MNQWLVTNKKMEEKTITIKKSNLQELNIIMTLQNDVFSAIENKDLFALTSQEQLAESIKEDYCLSIYEGDRLISFGLLIINRYTPRHGACHIYKENEKIAQTLTVDSIFIHPQYRGYGLQKKIFENFEAWGKAHGGKALFTTISPDNLFSLNNALLTGYKVVATKPLYGGKLRHILKKDL